MANDDEVRQREHDKRILVSIVIDIREQLSLIVFQRQELFRTEYRAFFPGPWQEVEERLSRAARDLENDDFNWEYVEGAGCRPCTRFASIQAEHANASDQRRSVGRLLKIVNSILGSLTSVFPFLEAVKEYKEHVEAAIAIQNRWK